MSISTSAMHPSPKQTWLPVMRPKAATTLMAAMSASVTKSTVLIEMDDVKWKILARLFLAVN